MCNEGNKYTFSKFKSREERLKIKCQLGHTYRLREGVLCSDMENKHTLELFHQD